MAETIFALATAPGRAAVAMIRISGACAFDALGALTGSVPPPRTAALRVLRRPGDGVELDRALVIAFPAPASFTGDDCAELHLHGGQAVVDGVVDALLDLGVRLAEPGEFTRRSFENGKLDLAQAEAVADLIEAETDAQRRQALAQLDGALSRRHAAWRDALIEALAVLEAAVDFPDEDLPADVAAEATGLLREVRLEIGVALNDHGRGERVREGYRVALIGAPNAGKSSLLNALIGRDAAIVTATPGTTRDVIEAPLTLAGYRVLLADTAGLRLTTDTIEAEGVRRALAWAEAADLRVFVVDRSGTEQDRGQWAVLARPGDLCLLNKADVAEGGGANDVRDWAASRGLQQLEVSVLQAVGLAAVRETLTTKVIEALSGADFPAATQARHRRDLADAKAHLDRAMEALSAGVASELVAEDVRLAARSLARISGRVDAEQVLDRVFSRFCIGK